MDQVRIVCKFKTIRDLAPHEHPGNVATADLQLEEAEDILEDVCAILDLAQEIQRLLPPTTDGNQEAQEGSLAYFQFRSLNMFTCGEEGFKT